MIHYLIDGGRKIPCACPRATDHHALNGYDDERREIR
jgi:hypothetical protein